MTKLDCLQTIGLKIASMVLISCTAVMGLNEVQNADFGLQESGNTLQSKPRISGAYGKLPLSFETNFGQADPRVKFLSRGRGYNLFLTSTEAVLQSRTPQLAALRMRLVGSSPTSEVIGHQEFAGKSNYFIGREPANWRTNIPNYARVHYRDVYPGVDLVYYGREHELKYDFMVAPGADPGLIKIAFDGAQKMHVDAGGDLVLRMAGGEIRQHKPVVYQDVRGLKKIVAGRYVIKGKREVGFRVAEYDATQALVIDPVLAYSTYLGGSGGDAGNSITVDSAGSVYVTGETASINFPTTAGALQTALAGVSDVFVMKLSANGSALVYSTYIGGGLSDRGNGIAIDSAGNAYVTGRTGSSKDFPIIPGAFQPVFRGGQYEAFVAALNPEGNALLYSTYLGGSANDAGFGIGIDPTGNAIVTGGTAANDFPTERAYQPVFGGRVDAFVTMLDPTGAALVYSTYFGGGAADRGNGIAVDSAGNAYLTGWTESIDFPLANPWQPVIGGGRDAFVTMLDAGGIVVYSTYLGGSGEDAGLGIALDSTGSAYVTGYTGSNNFPTANPFQATNGGGQDAFVTKFNADGSALVYSTYLGGSGGENFAAMGDTVGGIAVDAFDSAYVTGATASVNFPMANSVQKGYGGGPDDAFVTKFNAQGNALVYSTYLGGSFSDIGIGVALDSAASAYVTGKTGSVNFPTANPFQPASGGSVDAFISKIADSMAPMSNLHLLGKHLTTIKSSCKKLIISFLPEMD